MKIKTIVGLEIHAQLKTKTKAFCSCKNEYGAEPNTNTCPVCLGMPGGSPSLNKEAVNLAIMAGLSFNCNINNISYFERKKYFYPDLSKGYQVTQQTLPLCTHGYIEIEDSNNKLKKIGIQKIQVEEDTGKSLHLDGKNAYLDYNRSGIPLIEIVTEPDINTPEEAKIFLDKLKSTLVYMDISDGKMEEGSLRCDVNINLKDEDSNTKTNIIEIKNINSFSAVEKAIAFETKRQTELLKSGKSEVRSTRRWDDSISETVLMREKYTADDYKFSFDLDVLNLHVSDDYIEDLKSKMPELLSVKKNRFIEQYSLNSYDADILSSDKYLSEYFESLASEFENYELLANFIINELLRRINDEQRNLSELKFSKEQLIDLLNLVDTNKINNNIAKKVFRLMFEDGIDPTVYINENNLIQIDDLSEIEKFVDEALSENPSAISDFLNGKDRILGFLVGQVMKKSKGKADPKTVNELILKKINATK